MVAVLNQVRLLLCASLFDQHPDPYDVVLTIMTTITNTFMSTGKTEGDQFEVTVVCAASIWNRYEGKSICSKGSTLTEAYDEGLCTRRIGSYDTEKKVKIVKKSTSTQA
jgi:hypothetical protein